MSKFKRPIYMLSSMLLFGCGGGPDNEVDEHIPRQPFPIEGNINSLASVDGDFYFVHKQSLYMVEDMNFDAVYCLGHTFEHNGMGQISSTSVYSVDDKLFTSNGEVYQGYNLVENFAKGYEREPYYLSASSEQSFIIESFWEEQVSYSTDLNQWHDLYVDKNELPINVRFLQDAQYIYERDTLVTLFDAYTGSGTVNLLLTYHQDDWQLMQEDVNGLRLVYVDNTLLFMRNQGIQKLKQDDLSIEQELSIDNLLHFNVHQDSVIFTDGAKNWRLKPSTMTLTEYQLPAEIGMLTGIEHHDEQTYLSSNKGIWQYDGKQYLQLYKVEQMASEGCYSPPSQ
ncbi:hypothetical protein [Thalassotalea sp. Y01]|uniref:hypothetical protein n=1 Tax=Thalassotalea sp. Y01 TaxID=2729613 RepID=UPI00145C774A|nr:hypothetical protein [Thalassotalea sp. Y01]NMP15028.1 hypothetical protein [Thalassotalea sp. Y01]